MENGYDVDFFDERTSNNSFLKAIFRVKKDLLARSINKYYKDILKKINKKRYAYFLLIKGEVVPEWFILEFRKANPEARLIYYTYDSFNNNNQNSIYILKHFNLCYSFDFEDVKKNPSLKLKHLFYTKEFINDYRAEQGRKYKISFVGTLHSNRHSIIKGLFDKFDDTFLFYYLPARWLFLIDKISKKGHRKIKWSEVSFDKLSKQQVAGIFKSSKSVLDIQRSGQSGLTMRTFEVLAAGAVLITTNPYVKHADFYSEDRIVVLKDTDMSAHADEIQNKIDALNSGNGVIDEKLEPYYVNNWVKDFFE
ncbi:MAG TPA: glycosyltransferase [Mucilaginibacter sp.]|nr:glycosyltransferase [Mucilaginibacter sp.]